MSIKFKIKNKSTRRAITPIVATVLMIGLTVAVGFAAWAWAGSAAQNSENNLNTAWGSSINRLNENFEVVNANFSSTHVTLWFYNAGSTTAYVLNNLTTTVPSKPEYFTNTTAVVTCPNNAAQRCIRIAAGSLVGVPATVWYTASGQTKQVSLGSGNGTLYTFSAVGQYGNVYTYSQSW